MAETSSSTPPPKPVIVRVKRKISQSRLEAFWLEINERPAKRPLLDFAKLSLSDSSTCRVEETKTKKVLVQHVDTVTSSMEVHDVLRSYGPDSSDALKSKLKNAEGARSVQSVNKQEHLLVKAKQRQEVLSRTARFEQIWRSRKGDKEAIEDESVHEMCKLYDVVRVDVEEHEIKVQHTKDTDLEDYKMMAQYLPLLQQVLPTAAEELETDIHEYMSTKASSDGYVYDLYAVDEDASMQAVDSASQFPLVQVDDDEEFYDGPDDSDYQTDDSNAEDHPLNDYPDEEVSEDEDDEVTSKSSNENSEDESRTSGSQSQDLDGSYKCQDLEPADWSDGANQFSEYEMYSDGDGNTYDHDFGEEDWR